MNIEEAREVLEPVLKAWERDIATRRPCVGTYRFEKRAAALKALLEQEPQKEAQCPSTESK